MKEWFNEREAAVYTGVSVETLKRMRYGGKIRYGVKHDGRGVTYRRSDLDRAMENLHRFYDELPADPNAALMQITRTRKIKTV